MEIKTTVHLNFIAEDGTLFTTKEDCETYEKNCRSKEMLRQRFEFLTKDNELNIPSIFNPCNEYSAYLITLCDNFDVEAVLTNHEGEYYFDNSYVKGEMEELLKTHEFPFNIIYREDENYADIFDAEKVKEDTLDFLCGIVKKKVTK